MSTAPPSVALARRLGATGFTLLEVCVVLFIVAVVFVVTAIPATRLFEEERLHAPVRELQTFAKTARLRAMIEHQTYVLRLDADRYALAPANATEHGQPTQTYRLPSSIEFLARSPAEDDFHRVSDFLWYFAPNGLCEPMAFLFQKGRSWIRFRIDPLTARIQDEQSFIP